MSVKDLLRDRALVKEKEEVGKLRNYELVAPEGGWGFVITSGIAVAFTVTIVPLCAFGLVYGNFLASIGDETGGTTLANGLFNTVLSFAGLPANQLLQKYSYRKVAIIGSISYFLGAFFSIFVTSLEQLLVTFGILQGLGFGLLMPSAFTAFNYYFDKKKNLMMSICQAFMVAATIGWPSFTKLLLDNYGFRGTVAIYAALSLNAFAAVLTLQPVKWHLMKKPIIADVELERVDQNENKKAQEDVAKKEGEPLLQQKFKFVSHSLHELHRRTSLKPRNSVVSMGSMAISTTAINKLLKNETDNKEQTTFWSHISQMLDLGLFKDPKYVNIAFGLSLSITSDMAFSSLLPLLYSDFGYDTQEVTKMLTIYFSADLACRILLSVANALWLLRNRLLLLTGVLLSAAFRIGFVFNFSYFWTVLMTASLGFLRCLVQTPLPLVVAEEYPERFTTAFSLYMVVCGVVSLIVGLLLGFIKNLTSSNTMVVHVLTLAYLLCGIPWCLELIGTKFRRKQTPATA